MLKKLKRVNYNKFLFKSLLEKNIYNIIRKEFPTIKIFVNKTGLIKSRKKLELDLYLPNYNLGIEIQGPSHNQNATNIIRDYEKKIF